MPSKQGIHFEISERKILLRIIDVFVVLGALYLVGKSFEFEYFTVTKENWNWSVVLGVYLIMFGTVFELYDLQAASKIDNSLKNIILGTTVTVLVYLLTPILTPSLPEKRIEILYFFIIIVVALFLWRLAYMTLISSPRFYKKVLVIGDISDIKNIIKTIKKSDPNYRFVGFINSEKSNADSPKFKGLKEFKEEELFNIISKEKVSELLIAIQNPDTITSELYINLIRLLESGFVIREYSQVYEQVMHRVPIQYVGRDFYKYFPFSRSNQNRLYQWFSRTLDLITSIIGILFMVLILPIVLLGNLIGNRGKLFYSQERVGKNGKVFKIVKFRTMVPNAEKEGVMWAEKGDSRITTFGKLLRNLRIDEIPQFWNVLKGEMALIGPRPERPYFVKALSETIPFYETRHVIKPGLTGWAQVKMRYGSSIEDSLAKLQYDLYYIKRRSFFLDLNVLIKTVSTILYYRGQ